MKRMVIATAVLIITIAIIIISYAVVVFPVEYTIDALQDSYWPLDYVDASSFNNSTSMFPVLLAGSAVFGIFMMFVWYGVYGQKKEYEQD